VGYPVNRVHAVELKAFKSLRRTANNISSVLAFSTFLPNRWTKPGQHLINNSVNAVNKNSFQDEVRRCVSDVQQHGVLALGALFDLTAGRCLRYAQSITRSQEDAEDALQAAMVRITVKPHALAGADHPWPYFLRVVRNEALKIVRRRRSVNAASGFVDRVIETEDSVEKDDNRNQIRIALGRLPQNQCEVVVLKIWEGMTFAEIAEVLGKSPNTVASRYRYAMEKLQQQLCHLV
jgi:RNA polymerase sigma-70 factor (ECF subfamily)